MLKPGDKAPDFNLESTAGKPISLRELRGKKTVLYFYPKDNTPGCTQESCDFRDMQARLRAAGAEVIGVSKDSLSSHDKFREKYGLSFDLLSDPDSKIARAYGAYGQKMMYGKPIIGTIRSTFVIDEQGKIEAVWSPVKVNGHAEKVLAALTGQPVPEVTPAPQKKKPAAKKAPAKKRTAAKRR